MKKTDSSDNQNTNFMLSSKGFNSKSYLNSQIDQQIIGS